MHGEKNTWFVRRVGLRKTHPKSRDPNTELLGGAHVSALINTGQHRCSRLYEMAWGGGVLSGCDRTAGGSCRRWIDTDACSGSRIGYILFPEHGKHALAVAAAWCTRSTTRQIHNVLSFTMDKNAGEAIPNQPEEIRPHAINCANANTPGRKPTDVSA